MPIPASIADLSQTAGDNYPSGSESPATTDDYFRSHASFIAQLRDGEGYSAEVDVASAATCDIGAAASLLVRITGTTTITSFGTNYAGPRFIRFAGALTLTHNASTLILPGAANITTAAGDTCIATPISGGWVVRQYAKALYAPNAGALIGRQVFTASGTYTPTAGTNSVVVEVQAGGGGSGGTTSTTAGNWACGMSGAGGGYGKKRITSGFSGVTVTVGAGGAAGAGGSFPGGTGGTSSFGAHISCTGGAGGFGSGTNQSGASITIGASAAGGTATGADFSVPGEPGSGAICPNVATVRTPRGGRAFLGPGGAETSVVTGTGAGSTPSGYGGGASSGANCNSTQANQVGYAGAPGIVIVWEYS